RRNPAKMSARIMLTNYHGILLPVTTPFAEDEEFDRRGLTENIKKWNTTGITGYVILGSTGERVNLDEREYVEVIETARQAVPKELAFIAGAGQQSTRGTIGEIEVAARAGAEAVLVITPHYYRSAISQDALVSHYTAVADASSIPIILYSMPDLTGINIEPETAARLSVHENIVGIKDSSADVAKLAETVRLVPDDFAVMIGNGTVFCEALQAGARAGILAVGCAAPQLCVAIYDAVQAGEIDRASALQAALTPLARAVTKTYGIGGLKAALEMAGLIGGAVRAPLQLPGEEGRDEIAELLREAMDASGKAPLAKVSEPGAVATGS
ncbi:MAG TPA: dihydrodipicolinate synthase family protein, partial [Pyrinomonadaceae bacterium]|nr:dihydrodipicolinate synthase family protein [Pyrinomonadaceae bacterium]